MLCDGFRHPALLAKMAVTLDHLSGGRFELGIGWGSVPDELYRFDISNAPAPARSARLQETLDILELLFTGNVFDYEGQFYCLREAQQQPTPVNGHIPLVLGGGGARLTLPLVARYADWWNCPSYDVDRVDELRPFVGSARLSTQHPVTMAATQDELEDIRDLALRRFGHWGGNIVGTPETVVAHFAELAGKGVERFYVLFTDFAQPSTLTLFGQEVIPGVRAAVGA